MTPTFNYEDAFCRNLGWITLEEASQLRNVKVAIGGAGGVGGIHLITLARLGITKYHLSDPDTFELKNFNRQYGAETPTIGRNKCEVMIEKVKAINPEIQAHCFTEGITQDNVSKFLEGVDIYVDGLDVFEIEVREYLFEECARKNIPFVTAAPIGMGASVITFTKTSMSFGDYFGTQGKERLEKSIRFILGMAPSLVHLHSMVAREYSSINDKRVSSTPMGCHIASGIMGTEVLKILLNRSHRLEAPHCVHYDAYTYKLKKTNLWWGAKNPIFLIKLAIFKRILGRIAKKAKRA